MAHWTGCPALSRSSRCRSNDALLQGFVGRSFLRTGACHAACVRTILRRLHRRLHATLDLDNAPPTVCATPVLAAAKYPRSVHAGAVLTALVGFAATARLTIMQSTDGGTVWTPLTTAPSDGTRRDVARQRGTLCRLYRRRGHASVLPARGTAQEPQHHTRMPDGDDVLSERRRHPVVDGGDSSIGSAMR
jgi:hypothetical protein